MKNLTLVQLIERSGHILDLYHESFNEKLGRRYDNLISIIESYS
jgi:hypothetical protein